MKRPRETISVPLYTITPWKDHFEFESVGRALCCPVAQGIERAVGQQLSIEEALRKVCVWRSRTGALPHSVESTWALASIRWRDTSDSSSFSIELRSAYASAVTRSINGLADVMQQQRSAAISVSILCQKLGIPDWLVDLRHESTHNQLPSLSVLRLAANTLIDYFWNVYWCELSSLHEEQLESAFSLLQSYKAAAVAKSEREAAKKLESLTAQDTSSDENEGEDDSSEKTSNNGSSIIDDTYAAAIYGSKIGTCINTFALLEEAPRKKRIKKAAKSVPKKKKSEGPTPSSCTKDFLLSRIPFQIAAEALVSFLVTGKLGKQRSGRGVLIPGSLVTFPETQCAANSIFQRYSRLIVGVTMEWPVFYRVLLSAHIDMICSLERQSSIRRNDPGMKRKLFFLDFSVRTLLSESFLRGLVQIKVKSRGSSALSILKMLEVPINSLCDRLVSSICEPDVGPSTSKQLALFVDNLIGKDRVKFHGLATEKIHSQAPQEEMKSELVETSVLATSSSTMIIQEITTGRPLSLADMEAMLDGGGDKNPPPAPKPSSSNATDSNETESLTNAREIVIRTPWQLCSSWESCAIGSLPGSTA